MPVDGVYLALHGAMAVRNVPRPEAEIARRFREVVGPDVPIVGSFDLHANEDEQFLRWPAAWLILFSVITLILAVYAVMPKVSLIRRKLPPADLDDPMFNILFFGDFLGGEVSAGAVVPQRCLGGKTGVGIASTRSQDVGFL